jgi:hypothetical protein
VCLNRQIDVLVLPREQALAIPNIIRTASDLLPPDIGSSTSTASTSKPTAVPTWPPQP